MSFEKRRDFRTFWNVPNGEKPLILLIFPQFLIKVAFKKNLSLPERHFAALPKRWPRFVYNNGRRMKDSSPTPRHKDNKDREDSPWELMPSASVTESRKSNSISLPTNLWKKAWDSRGSTPSTRRRTENPLHFRTQSFLHRWGRRAGGRKTSLLPGIRSRFRLAG